MDFSYIVLPALIVLIGALICWLSIRRVSSLKRGSYPVWRKIPECIALSLVALVTVALAASSGFNAIALYLFRHPPPGMMYSVNGHRMRIDCMGSGSPTIILEAGAGNDGLTWSRVQPMLARTTQVCSYDRSGMGWSEALPPPRDADHVATELHGLLTAAKIDGPIVLMGHSMGGLFIRDYASRYPEEVTGMIFVDVSTPLQNRNPAFEAYDSPRNATRFNPWLDETAFVLGIPRLFGACSSNFPSLSARTSTLVAEDRCHEPFQTLKDESDSFDRSGEETIHTGPYGALPILIFSHDPSTDVADGRPADLIAAFNEMQENLKKLSTRSRRTTAKGSGHFIQMNRPDLIEKEVKLFIEQIRGVVPQPSDYGSTTTD
jgi:pimeloyl-ACP methyl ester carboxylesterase